MSTDRITNKRQPRRTRPALKPIAIYGAGGFGLEVAMLVEQINQANWQWDIIGFFDDGVPEGEIINNYPVLGGIHNLNQYPNELALVLALGIASTKKKVFFQISNDKISYPILIHPSVILGNERYVHIGEGSIICAGAIITTNINIGRHVIINLACTVGHESEIGDFSSLMPTTNISGEVKIGEATFWGTGSKAINGISVGSNVVIGAGAVVTQDIPENVTAVGVPAKIIKKHS
jgi:sugar O-acyltransferase (sialic acid O-acetyltransferase NeuD family)